jgi:hypothetical protein
MRKEDYEFLKQLTDAAIKARGQIIVKVKYKVKYKVLEEGPRDKFFRSHLTYNLTKRTYQKYKELESGEMQLVYDSTKQPDGYPDPHHNHTLQSLRKSEWCEIYEILTLKTEI